MKSMIAILTVMSISTSAFANECSQQAVELAKMNLNAKAKALQFDSADIAADSVRKVYEDKRTGKSSYTVEGAIYKADYTINMVLDSSCSIESLQIKE